eukprot:TRINITY_DN67335_c7_g3_i1.p1 TRINITY_DN67335_c7_g3~~TRINITY_DN67335_c7_g3_i1.p1  ORF type:complete len:235 (-),score=119.96 TRINITY_DN67335_c7_g3_i1:120-803(-)
MSDAQPVQPSRRRGRNRAAAGGWGSSSASASNNNNDASSSGNNNDASSTTPTVTAAAGGWGFGKASNTSSSSGDAPTKFGRRRGGAGGSAAASSSSGAFEEKKQETNSKWGAVETVTDIAAIPDIGEEVAEDLTRKVAHAPEVRADRGIQSIRELDDEVMHLPSSTEDGVDLSLLTKVLAPREQLREVDLEWDFDTLFTSLSSTYHMEKEMAAAEDGNEAESKEEDK